MTNEDGSKESQGVQGHRLDQLRHRLVRLKHRMDTGATREGEDTPKLDQVDRGNIKPDRSRYK